MIIDKYKNSNINFSGTFILRPDNIQTKNAIPSIIKKGRQILYNIKNEGDVVIVTKNNYDSHIRDFIEAKNLNFEYYPQISTKSGLDDQIPSKLKNLLKINDNCVISNLKILNKFLQKRTPNLSKQTEYLYEATNTLRLNIENPKIKIDDKGIFIIRDEAKKRTIKSTGFQNGNSYICVIPDNPNMETGRFLIGKNGKNIIKEYNTPKEIIHFYKTFKEIIFSFLW